MVLRTNIDSMGNRYGRRDAVNITCPLCEQNVDTQYAENFTQDSLTSRLVHAGCIERVYSSLLKKVNEMGREL